MTAFKTVGVAILAWGALATCAEAAPLSWFGSSNLSGWYANQSYANGGFYAPAGSPAPNFTNSNWFNSPSYLSSVGSPAQPSTTAATAAPPAGAANAFINFGTAPYADASTLTTGNAQAWYNSPAVTAAFGGTPTAAQQASFQQSVLSDIQHTFQISGLNITLTSDPTVPAQHMLSEVSGASYPSNPGAIGITTVGGNGFGFIDKLAYATSPDQLAWAVAHNISHELMHAFGVGTHPDTTGQYLDAATASWSLLTDPNTKFSPQAVQLIQAALGGTSLSSAVGAELLSLSKHPANCNCQFCQAMRKLGIDGAQLLAPPVPEPATVALWTISATGAILLARRRASRKAA
jgi:hypothetical protein